MHAADGPLKGKCIFHGAINFASNLILLYTPRNIISSSKYIHMDTNLQLMWFIIS